jgi:hypothetical protein
MKIMSNARFAAFLLLLAAGGLIARADDRAPSEERLTVVRKQFMTIKHPLSFHLNVEKTSSSVKYDNSRAFIVLDDDAKRLAEVNTENELIHGLWPFLDEHAYDSDAMLILLACVHAHVSEGYAIHYDARSDDPDSWPRQREDMIAFCKTQCRRFLGQPEWWYPHKVLFDRDTVLAESKTNALARTAYIAAMQKALADPKIRSDNPLEVKSILGLLCELDANEAATNFCDYLFYDWKTASEHRIQEHDKSDQGIYPVSSLAAIACLARLGEKSMPQVFDRFANATPEECSMQVGGGGLPILAIRYFYLQFMKETDAVKKLEDYKQEHPNLTELQITALNSILDAIKTKKYRPFFMDHSDWAAPKTASTNAPPTK